MKVCGYGKKKSVFPHNEMFDEMDNIQYRMHQIYKNYLLQKKC
jgi:hypothetical protein